MELLHRVAVAAHAAIGLPLSLVTVEGRLDLRKAPPAGSRISFRAERADLGTFLIPSTGLTKGHVPALLFAVAWIGFVAFWTVGFAYSIISRGGGAGILLPLLFSIPFWFVGLSMLAGLINSIRERQEIEVGRCDGEISGLEILKQELFTFDM